MSRGLFTIDLLVFALFCRLTKRRQDSLMKILPHVLIAGSLVNDLYIQSMSQPIWQNCLRVNLYLRRHRRDRIFVRPRRIRIS